MKLDSIFDIYGSPGYLLRRSGQFVTSTFENLANDSRITTGQMTVLLAIYFEPGLQQLELAARLNWDEATMGGMIKRLESNGYIERRSSTRSSRGRQIYLTEEGLQLYKHLRPKILQTQRKLMKNLTPDETTTLLYLLSKLLDIDTPHFSAKDSKTRRSRIK
jgi:DNA-binding MarR family transcriptional regulator